MINCLTFIISRRYTERRPAPAQPPPVFDLRHFLDSAGVARDVTTYARSALVFSQGDPATHVFYLQRGSVKLSVLSPKGKEAIVAVLGAGDFFGEGCLAGQPRRMGTASALSASTVLVDEKPEMLQKLRTQPDLAECFLTHMLSRNIRIEEDLIDQLFNSSEKRLASARMLRMSTGFCSVLKNTFGSPPVSAELSK